MSEENYREVFGTEAYQVMAEEKTTIKLKYNYDIIKMIEGKYSCGEVINKYDDDFDGPEFCLHKTKELAIECMEKRIDYLNSVCPNCEDSRMVKDCPHAFHRLPRVKMTKGNWRINK